MKDKWGKKYPKEILSWENQLPTLLTFYRYPALIREAIYTSNPIERTNKEFRNRLRPMNSLTNVNAAEKIVYLEAVAYNDKWGARTIRGFANASTKEALTRMYLGRYSADAVTV